MQKALAISQPLDVQLIGRVALANSIADCAIDFVPFSQWVEPLDEHFTQLMSLDFLDSTCVQLDCYV